MAQVHGNRIDAAYVVVVVTLVRAASTVGTTPTFKSLQSRLLMHYSWIGSFLQFAQAWDTALVDKSVGGAQAGEKCAWPVAAACVFAASKLNDEENVTTSLTAALTETHTERSGGQGNPEDRAKAKKGQFKGMYASGNKKHGKI